MKKMNTFSAVTSTLFVIVQNHQITGGPSKVHNHGKFEKNVFETYWATEDHDLKYPSWTAIQTCKTAIMTLPLKTSLKKKDFLIKWWEKR